MVCVFTLILVCVLLFRETREGFIAGGESQPFFGEILDEWNVSEKIGIVEEMMVKFGFNEMVEEMRSRFSGYNDIIMSEF